MSVLRKNIIANFLGSFVQAAMGIAFVPLYIRFLGIESWGLVGFFGTLQAVFSLLDLGLSSTLNRELARLSVTPGGSQSMRDLVRTLEVIYWGIALFVAGSSYLAAPLIATGWLKPGAVPPNVVQDAIVAMGVIIAFQMPIGFYSGGLMGLQRQISVNVINVALSTLRGIGATLILWLVAPTVRAYFCWQLVVSITGVALFSRSLWRALPIATTRPHFQLTQLSGIWRFALGMSGTALLATGLTQVDKVILSRLLSLESFGYYSLASLVGMSMTRLFTPVFYSVYPRLTQLVALKDEAATSQLYHRASQFFAIIILPAALTVSLFSSEILATWTRSSTTTTHTSSLVSALVCGTAINGLMNAPYALQLANGWSRFSAFKCLIALLVIAPLVVVLTRHWGAQGAALAWIFLHAGFFAFEVPIMHRRLLRGEMMRWYLNDIGCALAAATGSALVLRWILDRLHLGTPIFYVCCSFLAIEIAAVLSTSLGREWSRRAFDNFRYAAD